MRGGGGVIERHTEIRGERNRKDNRAQGHRESFIKSMKNLTTPHDGRFKFGQSKPTVCAFQRPVWKNFLVILIYNFSYKNCVDKSLILKFIQHNFFLLKWQEYNI